MPSWSILRRISSRETRRDNQATKTAQAKSPSRQEPVQRPASLRLPFVRELFSRSKLRSEEVRKDDDGTARPLVGGEMAAEPTRVVSLVSFVSSGICCTTFENTRRRCICSRLRSWRKGPTRQGEEALFPGLLEKEGAGGGRGSSGSHESHDRAVQHCATLPSTNSQLHLHAPNRLRLGFPRVANRLSSMTRLACLHPLLFSHS